MTTDTVRRAKRRLLKSVHGVDLDAPFFEVTDRIMARIAGCDHTERGVRLDQATRTAWCKCGAQVDLFDALLIYAHAEQRLERHANDIRQASEAEARRKRLDQERRPFARRVVNKKPIKDLALKAEPVTGYTLTLECGHQRKCGPDRIPKRATCHTCKAAGAPPA